MPRLRRAWLALPAGLRLPIAILGRTFHLYVEDGCNTHAAAIAYFAIFSLVPLALVILSVFGLIVDRERIVSFVFDQVPLKETASVQENVNTIVKRAQAVSPLGLTLGVLALTWSASSIFGAVRGGLNVATHHVRTRPYWRGKLVDFALIPILGMLILLSIGLTAVAQFAVERTGGIGPVTANGALLVTSYIVPVLVSFTLFLLLYRLVPTVRPRTSEAIAGALFATLLFETAKNVYAIVIAVTPFSSDTALYASFGTALVFLFWMFINASILLLGAEFWRALSIQLGRQHPAQAAPAPGPRQLTTPADSVPPPVT